MTATEHLTAIRKIATTNGIFSLYECDSLYLAVESETDLQPIWQRLRDVTDCRKECLRVKADGGGNVLKITITDL